MRKGFTLVELMIAMTLSALIFVTVSSLLVTILTANTKSRRQEAFEQVKNDLGSEFSSTLRWAQEVVIGEDDSLTVDGKVYRADGGRLTKDGQAITPEGVRVESFSVNSLSRSADLTSVKVEVELTDASFNLAQDRLVVVVSQRQTEVGGGP